MLKSHHARCLSTLASVVVLAMVTPMAAFAASSTAQSGTAAGTRATASRSGLIPVWAYLDGSDPVVGGRVSIIAGGKPVAQLGPHAYRLTNAHGVALVSVRRIPRRFTVVVRGGRAAGRRLVGSLRSGRSGPDTGVVDVNPQRTAASLAPDLARIGPGVGAVRKDGLSDLSAGQLVHQVFAALGGTALKIGGNTLVGGVFGGLLQLAQLAGITVPKSSFEKVQEQLTAIGGQLTELQGQVNMVSRSIANSDASRLLRESDHLTSSINHATDELVLLSKVDPNETARREGLAATIAKYIRKHLSDAPEQFDTHLNPAFAIADNPIKATSRALATSSRFFDARQSDEVRAVYDYYAMYEAELAVLLTNYWNTDPVIYPLQDREERLEKIKTSVTKTQTESLKPTVPAGTFIDTQTPLFIWGTSDATENALDLLTTDKQTRFNISLGPFHN
jgi:hypothetical protein